MAMSTDRYARLGELAERDGANCRSKGLAPGRRDTEARARLFHIWTVGKKHLTAEDRDDLFDRWLEGFNGYEEPPAPNVPNGYR